MKSVYIEDDDILEIRVSDKPIAREVSQGWHTNISYAEDGSIVEIVLLARIFHAYKSAVPPEPGQPQDRHRLCGAFTGASGGGRQVPVRAAWLLCGGPEGPWQG